MLESLQRSINGHSKPTPNKRWTVNVYTLNVNVSKRFCACWEECRLIDRHYVVTKRINLLYNNTKQGRLT